MALYIGNKKYCAVKKIGVNNKDILITENGNYSVTEPEYSGFGVVRVQVPTPIFDELTVDPKTTSQTITPLNDGFSKVIVNPVTSAIDADIVASNIKKGIDILGVTGTLEFVTEEITITPTTAKQTKTPTKDGFSKVVVNGVTSAIDANIIAGNIKKDVKILGVTGTLIESNETTRNITANGTFSPAAPYTGFSSVEVDVKAELEELNITPKVTAQTFTSVDDYHGYSPVNVAAVTSAIDSNIKAANIKQGITILGVTGTVVELNGETRTEELTNSAGTTYTPSTGKNAITSIKVTPKLQAITITPSTTAQTKTVPTGYAGYGTITVSAVTSSIDADIKAENIKKGVDILGVVGTLDFTTEEKTVTPSTSQQVITPSTGINGISKVTVKAVDKTIDSNITAANIKKGVTILGVTGTSEELKAQTKTITANGTYTPDTGYNGFSSVTVNVNTVKNQEKTITENGTYTPDTGYTGFSKVIVDVVSAVNKSLTVDPKGTKQTFTPEEGYTGFNPVVVNAVSAAADANIKPENIVKGVKILGVTGTAELKLQEKHVTIDSTTPTITTYTPDQDGCNGYSKFIFDLTWLEDQLKALNAGDTQSTIDLQNITVTDEGTYTADTGYDGIGSVTVDLTAYKQQIEDLKGQRTTIELDDFLSADMELMKTDNTYIREYACYYYVKLKTAILNNMEVIGLGAFAYSGLTNLVIKTSQLCTLQSAMCLEGTPIANGIGYIYVPDTLVNSYKADTNWAIYANQIKPLSQYVA